jgi:hypothetical protein
VLAVAGEGEVLGTEGAAGADLRGFLPEGRRPQADLTVPLEGEGLGVDTTRQHEVAVQAADGLVVAVEAELGVLDAFAGRCQQLDEWTVVADLIGHGCAHGSPLFGRSRGVSAPDRLVPIVVVPWVVGRPISDKDVTAVTPA